MTRASMAWRLAPAPSTRPREPARRSGRLESRRPSSRAVRVTIASSAAPDAAAVTAIASARASTVIVAPDVRSRLPFMSSSRHGSGVVVSLSDDADPPDPSHLRVVTAAHVACLAGPRNSLRVRFPGVPDAPDRRARVIAVHPTLDLALLAFADDRDDARARPSPPSSSPAWTSLADAVPDVGEPVAALGHPMGWSGAVRSIAGRGIDDVGSGRWGTLLARHPADVGSSTHALHDSPVASGESGGPLLDARGRVFGVHSFGDAFYGGERDVAVVVTRDRMVEMERAAEAAARAEEAEETRGVRPGEYATAAINRRVFESSDPALAAMCPELTAEQRRAWIL